MMVCNYNYCMVKRSERKNLETEMDCKRGFAEKVMGM